MPEQDSELNALEAANADLTRTFNQAWSDRDCDSLLGCLADDVRWMVYEGGPVHEGPEKIGTTVRRFMEKYERIDFDILRLQVMGSVVIHERTEHYYAPGGELDTRFHVVGLLVIRDGRIAIWRDYAMVGAQQLVGPLCAGTAEGG